MRAFGERQRHTERWRATVEGKQTVEQREREERKYRESNSDTGKDERIQVSKCTKPRKVRLRVRVWQREGRHMWWSCVYYAS